MRHWCIKRLASLFIYDRFPPRQLKLVFMDDALGYMTSTALLRCFQLKRLKKQLLSSLLVLSVYLNTPAPPLPHQITLKLLLPFRFDFLPDVAMTQLITLFWALWFWRDLITQYSLHRPPYIASAWWHSLWGCGRHDNLLRKIHNVSLPPSVVHMFTLSWWGGVCFLKMF